MSDDKTEKPQPEIEKPSSVGTSTGNTTSKIGELSAKLLEQTQKNTSLENENLEIKRKNTELLRQIHASRKMKEESDIEVQKLSTEVEELSATLFDQANNKVKQANITANDFKVRNEKLIDSLKQKDQTIELLNNELKQLKDMLSDLTASEKVTPKTTNTPNNETTTTGFDLGDASFTIESLKSLNGCQIYTPVYNQLRFDLHSFDQFRRALSSETQPFNIRSSSFFSTLMTEEIEPLLRLDLSPSVKFYRRRSFITGLMDYKVTIEPLSASTEVWKSNNIQQSSVSTEDIKVDVKMFKYATDRPVASPDKCSICGELRKEMNFARLYKLKVKDYEYPLCISCASKLRSVVELLKFLKGLTRTIENETVIHEWCQLAALRGKMYYTKLGIWAESDQFGLVYGWKNKWLNQEESQSFAGNMSEIPKSSAASIIAKSERNSSENNSSDEKTAETENSKGSTLDKQNAVKEVGNSTTEDSSGSSTEFNDAVE